MPADNKTGIVTIDASAREIGIMVRVPDESKGEKNIDMVGSIMKHPEDAASVQWCLIVMGIVALMEQSGFQKQMLLAGIKARGGQAALDKALEAMPELTGSSNPYSQEPTTSSEAFDMIMGAKGPDKKKMN